MKIDDPVNNRNGRSSGSPTWRQKSALGGVEVSEGVREAALTPLADWARRTFGALDTVHEAEEQYALAGVELHGGPTDDP